MHALSDALALLVFVFVLLVLYFIRSLRRGREAHSLSVKRLTGLLPESQRMQEALAAAPTSPESSPLSRWPLLGAFLARVHMNLMLLGWHQQRSKILMVVISGLMTGGLVGRMAEHPLILTPLVGVLSTLVVFTALYTHELNQYYKELQQALPEAIDAITRTCRAGVPVSNVFSLVHKHLNGPLATEFQLIDRWLQLGVPLKRVMQDSSRRIPLPEYRFFVVILIINQEAGGSLTSTLERLTDTLRGRLELQLKIQSKTSEARASAKIVSALVPCILGYMYLNSPQDFRFLLDDPVGHGVLAYTTASVLLGLSITYAMVRRVR